MSLIVSVVGQKGGSGKSTLARAIGTCYAQAEWDVKIADLDVNQSTSFTWLQRRLNNNVNPVVAVEAFGNATQALKKANNYDLFVFDGAPTASRATSEICAVSDLIIIPTGLALDDLEPSVLLANNLKKSGVESRKICFVFNRASGSEVEYSEARSYLSETPYFLVDGKIEDKPCYRQAMNDGLSIAEVKFKKPREKVDFVIQNIINRLEEITK